MKPVVGVDLGSRTTKILQWADDAVIHSEIFDTGHFPIPDVKERLKKLKASKITATGYGRHLLSAHFDAHRVTEIKACGKGAHR